MAVANASYAAIHDTAGKTNNPGTSTVLADTGQMDSALYEVRIFIGCSVAATFSVQHRDSTNASNVDDVPVLFAAAGQTGMYVFKFAVNHNERIRVVPETAITGDAAVTIQAVRVA